MLSEKSLQSVSIKVNKHTLPNWLEDDQSENRSVFYRLKYWPHKNISKAQKSNNRLQLVR